MLDVDGILSPWWDRLQTEYGELDLYDAHTHVGANDPDGVQADARGAADGARARPRRARSCSRCTSPTAIRAANDA